MTRRAPAVPVTRSTRRREARKVRAQPRRAFDWLSDRTVETDREKSYGVMAAPTSDLIAP